MEDEPTSPWEFVGSVCKYYRFTYDYVLWDISYVNLSILLSAIPETDLGSDEETAGKNPFPVAGKPHTSAEQKEMDLLKSFFKGTQQK